MPHTDLNGIVAFLAVARQRSFTRAAAQLGVSQSALSQTLRGLEARLDPRDIQRAIGPWQRRSSPEPTGCARLAPRPDRATSWRDGREGGTCLSNGSTLS